MYADRVIVCKDGRYWQFDYTIDAANNVQLAEPKEVIEQFLPVALKEALAGAERGVAARRRRLDAGWCAPRGGRPRDEGQGLGRGPSSAPGCRRTARPTTRTRCCAKRRRSSRARACLRQADDEHLKKDAARTCELVGWISDVKLRRGQVDRHRLLARPAERRRAGESLRETIADAWKRGKRDLVGALDRRATARSRKAREAGGRKRVASRSQGQFRRSHRRPGAGGALVRTGRSRRPPGARPDERTDARGHQGQIPHLDVAR
jgi:hypothetical protein